jgi:Na+/pantothenate symporter
MPAWLQNERVENTLIWLARLTLAASLLLLIAVPIIAGTRLLETAITIAIYLMIASFAICVAINALALFNLLTTILGSGKRSRYS